MAKKHKKSRISFESKITQKEKKPVFSVKELIKEEKWFILLFISIAILVHFQTMFNDFVILDDFDIFVNNDIVKNTGQAFATWNINTIIFSIFYKLFGTNAMPLHVMSVFMHAIIVGFAYINARLMFDKKIAQIATLMFAVHPVGVEAVGWISGNSYLYITMCGMVTLAFFLFFKETRNSQWLLASVAVYSLFLIFYRSPWMFLTPFVVLLVDQFIVEKKLSIEALNNWMLFVAPLGVFTLVFMTTLISQRIHLRDPDTVDTENKVTGRYQNQEGLAPIIEGAPYTTYSMSRLYVFPLMQSSMYDGKTVEKPEYIAMYAIFVLYVFAGIYVFIKNKRFGVIFVILPLLIAPSYSPVKVTWYVAERYLYFGSFFYAVLFAGFLYFVAEKLFGKDTEKIQKFVLTAAIFVSLLLAFKTNIRIRDWKDSMAFSLALTKTAPQSARTWAYLGTSHLFINDHENALKFYDKALQIDYFTNSAANNTGVILIEGGPEYIQKRHAFDSSQVDNDTKFASGLNFFYAGFDARAMFLLADYLKTDPTNIEVLDAISEIYIRSGKHDFGEQMIQKVLELGPPTQRTLSNMAFIEYNRQNFDLSREYIKQALEIDPSSQFLLQSLEIIEQSQKQKVE